MPTVLNRTIILSGFNELSTTALGENAYHGSVEVVRDAVRDGIDWATEETHPLHAALLAGRAEVALLLLDAGSPINDETYRLAVAKHPEVAARLPPRPELVAALELGARSRAFNFALFHGDVMAARQIAEHGVDIRAPALLSHGPGPLCPIHYAARLGTIEAFELVLEFGGDLHALSPEGKSATRLVAEQPSLRRADRARVLRYLMKRGGRITPSITTTWLRVKTRLGYWLNPTVGMPIRVVNLRG